MTSPTRRVRRTPPPTVEDVFKLLDCLYLQPRSEILTFPLYEKRYRADEQQRAVAFLLEQSRHLVNASRNHLQIGLCCFHTGLIYRRWGHHLNAAHFFNDARLYWNLVDEQPYVCLAQFAQATAQHEGLQLKEALSNYEKVQQCLSRLKKSIAARVVNEHRAQINTFCAKIERILADIYPQLSRELWELTIEVATPPPPPQDPPDNPVETDAPSPQPTPTPVHDLARPRIHPDLTAAADDNAARETEGQVESGALTGRSTPIYPRRWFKLTNGRDNFLQELKADDMILVSLAGAQIYQKDELLATTGYIPDAVQIRPCNEENEDKVYYLGLYAGPNESGAWVLFHNGQPPTAVPSEAIIGHVITNWRSLSD